MVLLLVKINIEKPEFTEKLPDISLCFNARDWKENILV